MMNTAYVLPEVGTFVRRISGEGTSFDADKGEHPEYQGGDIVFLDGQGRDIYTYKGNFDEALRIITFTHNKSQTGKTRLETHFRYLAREHFNRSPTEGAYRKTQQTLNKHKKDGKITEETHQQLSEVLKTQWEMAAHNRQTMRKFLDDTLEP